MENLTHKVDRTGWAPGPWDGEPDREDWEHQGVPCFVLRSHHGNWCGYAGVPPGHPLFQVTHEDLDVHGGITYHGMCSPPICHVAKPGEPDNIWWFGFDCGHVWDIQPGMDALLLKLHNDAGDLEPFRGLHIDAMSTYKTLAYVKAEVNRLAEQLVRNDLTTPSSES